MPYLLPDLYHWSPAARFAAIRVEGLRPQSDPCVAGVRLGYVCLGVDPGAAWSLSGAMGWVDDDLWDLWQVRLAEPDSVTVRPDFGPRLLEVKIHGPVPADRLWWVARRDSGLLLPPAEETPPDG